MSKRQLIVVADDFGIGHEVSRGILELMLKGSVTSTVLIVNSPYAAQDMRQWFSAGCPGEMGWHPNLTMDHPIAPARKVPGLLTKDQSLVTLGSLVFRLLNGTLQFNELVSELDAQYQRFHDLAGFPPPMINGHKHIHVFPPIHRALMEVLKRWKVRPYIRCVREPLTTLRAIPGARIKRAFLTLLGSRSSTKQLYQGFPGNHTLAGITDPQWVSDKQFFSRWLQAIPGSIVELAVHPGYRDESLIGRDCTLKDGQLERRVAEMKHLLLPEFIESCHQAGFELVAANPVRPSRRLVHFHAA